MSIDNIVTGPALAGMRALNQWVMWRLGDDPKRPGKPLKLPFNARTGALASSTDPTTWCDIATAAAAARVAGDGWGVGFVFSANDPYVFIDIDSCALHDGTWTQFAMQLMTQVLPGAAREVSQSGRGLHLFGRGTVRPHGNKNAEHRAEAYSRERFVALTGDQLSGNCDHDLGDRLAWVLQTYFPPRVSADRNLPITSGPRAEYRGPPDTEEGNAELLRRAMQSRSTASKFGNGKASFADLWHADAAVLARAYPPDANSGDPYDRSSADAALAQMLAFWTGADPLRAEKLMRLSKLDRDKWSRDDYIDRTIMNACRQQRDVLQDKPVPASPFVAAPAPAAPPAPPAPGLPPPPPEQPARTAPTATMRARTDQQAFLGADAQRALFDGCVYVIDHHRVLTPPGGRMLKPDQFRAAFGGKTFVMDAQNSRTTRNAFEAFTESHLLQPPIVDGTCFKPLYPAGTVIESEGRKLVNTYWPANVRRVVGDVTPFLRHLSLVLPNEGDRSLLIYFLANMVQNAGHKAQFAPLIVGVPGNGKTFFSRCATAAIGKRYSHWPAANKLGKDFNEWLFGKLAYFVEDVFVKDAGILEKMKPLITGEIIEVEGKGVDQRTADVCGNFIFNANRRDAVQKTGDDRRYMVLWCAQQSVEDLARDGMDAAYFSALYQWANEQDGYAIVAEYLHTLPLPADRGLQWFMGRAPKTSSTADAIEATRGPFETEVIDAVEEGAPGFRDGWISSIMLKRRLESRRKLDVAGRNEWTGLLKGLGYVPHPGLANGQTDNIVMPDAAKPRLFVRQDHEAHGIQQRAVIASTYTSAQQAR